MRLRLLGLLLVCLIASGVWAQEATPETTPQSLSDAVLGALNTTSASEVDLSQSFTEENGIFTLNYPKGWLARGGYGQVYIANSQEALNRGFEAAYEPGEVQIGVFTGTVADLMPDANLPADADAEAIISTIIEMGGELSEQPATFGEVVTTSIHDQSAASVTFTRPSTDAYALIIDTDGDAFIAFQMLTAPGELEQWLPMARAIAETISLDPSASTPEPLSALTESITLPDESFTVKYPEGWAARESSPNGVDIASSPEALDLWSSDDFAPGDVRIYVGSGAPDDLFGELDVTNLSPAEILKAGIDREDDEDIKFDEPEPFVINDRQAASTFVSQPNLEGYVFLIRYTDTMFVAAYLQTAVGEAEQWQPLILDMLHRL